MANQAIGIDIGTHAIKVAVLQRKGAVTRALRLFRAPIAGDIDFVRIKGALARAGISGGPGLVGVTGKDLIVRYTHVPPVPDWRLKLLMQFEINEVSGQSGGEVAADYRRLDLPVEGDEDTVLVALARNTYLQPRLSAARGSGMKVSGGCANSVALFNAFLAHGSWADGETIYIVSLGRENIDMAIQRDGELLFARNMSGGGQMFTEAIMSTFGLKEPKAEKNKITKGDLTPKGQARYADSTGEKLANAMLGPAGQLVSMIQSSVMICRAQTKMTDLNVDKLVLTGGGSRMRGIQKYFQANMQVPIELFDPIEDLDLSNLDSSDAEALGDDPRDFTVAIGLAQTLIQPTAFKLEVLTGNEKKKRRFLERTIWALGAAVAAIVLVVLLFQSRAADIRAYEAANLKLKAIKAKANAMSTAKDRARAEEKEARFKDLSLRIRGIPGLFTAEVMQILDSAHPEYIYLESIRMEVENVAFGLDGKPVFGATRGRGMEEGNKIVNQAVWPSCEVRGVVQRDYTPDPGLTYNRYTRSLLDQVRKTLIEGWQLELKTESIDRKHKFRMVFSLKASEAKPEEEG